VVSDGGVLCVAGLCANFCPTNVNTTAWTEGTQRVIMATFNRERVEHALNELLVRIVPEDPDDSEEAANERFDEAYTFAIETLSTAGDPDIVPDETHIADLIGSRSKAP
jgi:hypothetical protein